MDIKSETYFHTAVLACTRPTVIATKKSNLELRELLSKFGSFEAIFQHLNPNIPQKVAEELRRAEKYLEKLELPYGMSTCVNLDFPQELGKHRETTPVIYYRGNLSLLNRDCIAVVGTRQDLSSAELSDAKKVLAEITKKNYVIVSGLAKGCDTLAHLAGLQTGTVAVLGTPLNKYYPRENETLQERIAQEHLLISQFPIGIDRFLHYNFEQPLNFKKRNQTTVALSNKGVVVIKTLDKGGTQNAIQEARNLSRPLYALKGNFVPENTWVNEYVWEDYGTVRLAK